MVKLEINKNYIAKLKQQRKVIGLLRFETKEDTNFSKWYALTENLIIKSFGEKSNQIAQLRGIRNGMVNRYDLQFSDLGSASSKSNALETKQKLKNLLSVFIEELELDVEEEPKPTLRKDKNISIKMNNTQTINQIFDVSIQIKNIIENIRQTESDPERVIKAEEKLRELETQMKSSSPAWSTVKEILVWLLNFGRDVFLQALPIILQKYR